LVREEVVDVVGLEEDLDAARLEDTSDSEGQDSQEEEEGHEDGVGLYDEGVGWWVCFSIFILTPI
jgi:hypothetical protein